LPRLPRVSGRRLERALRRAGFVALRGEGDHVFLHHPDTGRTATIVSTPKDLPVGTVASILRQAGLSAEDLRKLLR
jgi:predicted RNA binding protein YcfA (HicA-like mRNA interferase family)